MKYCPFFKGSCHGVDCMLWFQEKEYDGLCSFKSIALDLAMYIDEQQGIMNMRGKLIEVVGNLTEELIKGEE